MRSDDKRQLFAALGMVGTIGISMVANIAVGLFGGRFFDNWLGTGPWCTVGGIVLGMVSGLWATYKRIMQNTPGKGE